MATDDRSQSSSLNRLEKTGEEYNFFQVSRLLEGLSDGDGASLRVKFAGNNSFALRPNFVERVNVEGTGASASITVEANGFNLFGNQSPIPEVYLEQIAQEAQAGNDGATAFLNIFNDKILREFYELKKRFDPMLFNGSPKEEDLFRLFESVSGVPRHSRFEGQMPSSYPRFWRKYAYQYSNRRVSYGFLKELLSKLVGVDVAVESNTGGWRVLPKERQACLGHSGALGASSTLGRRYWSHDNSIGLTLTLENLEDYDKYLPGSEDFSELVALIAVLTDLLFDIQLKFRINPSSVAKLRLGKTARLGFSTWLKHQDAELNQAGQTECYLRRDDLLAALESAEAASQ